jgi:hypothetical protein
VALLVVVLLPACRSGRASGGGDIAVLQPSPVVTPEPPPPPVVPSPTPQPAVTALDLADQAFESGDYATALGGYRNHLDGEGGDLDADRALFRLGVLHLLNGGPAPDTRTGHALLRRLVREHPESPYRMQAEVILGLASRVDGLESEVDRLETQLEALKRIDLERVPGRHSP